MTCKREHSQPPWCYQGCFPSSILPVLYDRNTLFPLPFLCSDVKSQDSLFLPETCASVVALCAYNKIKILKIQQLSFHPLAKKSKPKPKQAHLPLWKWTSGFQEHFGHFLDTSTSSSSQSLNQRLRRLLAVACCNVFHCGMCTRKTTNPREETKDSSHFICTQRVFRKKHILRDYNWVHE